MSNLSYPIEVVGMTDLTTGNTFTDIMPGELKYFKNGTSEYVEVVDPLSPHVRTRFPIDPVESAKHDIYVSVRVYDRYYNVNKKTGLVSNNSLKDYNPPKATAVRQLTNTGTIKVKDDSGLGGLGNLESKLGSGLKIAGIALGAYLLLK